MSQAEMTASDLVVVRANDAAVAVEVLDTRAVVERGDDSSAAAAQDEASSAICQQCGSERVVRVTRGKRMAVLSWLLVGIPVFPVWRQCRCENCGFVSRS